MDKIWDSNSGMSLGGNDRGVELEIPPIIQFRGIYFKLLPTSIQTIESVCQPTTLIIEGVLQPLTEDDKLQLGLTKL